MREPDSMRVTVEKVTVDVPTDYGAVLARDTGKRRVTIEATHEQLAPIYEVVDRITDAKTTRPEPEPEHSILDVQTYLVGCTCGDQFYDHDPERARLRFLHHAAGLNPETSDRIIILSEDLAQHAHHPNETPGSQQTPPAPENPASPAEQVGRSANAGAHVDDPVVLRLGMRVEMFGHVYELARSRAPRGLMDVVEVSLVWLYAVPSRPLGEPGSSALNEVPMPAPGSPSDVM